ncbi:YwqH-like family protein [Peribacillus sp. NPDC096540]|uniref:YwqH-like family protein n=1 Tax=Peribacillus sp. NPDC096540 TaxID=3390612 RepID=UPI003D00D978
MVYADILSNIHSAISSKKASLDEKIERLVKAKDDIIKEQSMCLNEIRNIKNPDLGSSWTGSRSDNFQEARSDAYNVMFSVIHDDYDDYQWKIEAMITKLSAENTLLSIAGNIAQEADSLLSKGEEAFEQLESKISDLKRRLI